MRFGCTAPPHRAGPPRGPLGAAVLVALLLALAGCGSPSRTAAGGTGTRTGPATTGTTTGTGTGTGTGAASTGTGAGAATAAGPATPRAGVPAARWHHVVLVVMENHAYREVIGDPAAPFLNGLARRGVSFSRFTAEAHPSEPNYLALFSGSTHAVRSDACPLRLSGPNLATALRAAHRSFAGFSEGLPRAGWPGCSAGEYARKHVPWADFPNVPAALNRPMRAFPADLTRLPSVAVVVPNLQHDMHDGSVAAGDAWLHAHLGHYAAWATGHRSLLVVTWDEADAGAGNRIPTVAVGSGVRRGVAGEPVNHYRLLRTVLVGFGARPMNAAAHVAAIPQLLAG